MKHLEFAGEVLIEVACPGICLVAIFWIAFVL